MTNKALEEFINTYQKYYFCVDANEKAYGKEKLGISIIHPTKKIYEEKIIGYLRDGKQNIETIAWKMGGNISEDGIKTQYYEYPIENINAFCNEIDGLTLPIRDNKQISDKDLRDSYEEILKSAKSCDLDGYGSVYIINTMFFVSKGNVPIYDYYANVAVKALLKDCCPQDVFVGQAPGKDEYAKGGKINKLAMNMLIEYQNYLTELAGETKYYKTEGFISRELDQALWGYGHATKKWSYKESE